MNERRSRAFRVLGAVEQGTPIAVLSAWDGRLFPRNVKLTGMWRRILPNRNSPGKTGVDGHADCVTLHLSPSGNEMAHREASEPGSQPG